MDGIVLFVCIVGATVAGVAGLHALASDTRAAGLYLAGAVVLLMMGAFSARRLWRRRMLQRLVAIALVLGCASSAQAQRVAAIAITAHTKSSDSTSASRESVLTSYSAVAATSAPATTIGDGQHGSVWMWVAVGVLAGGVVGGSMMKAHCSRDPGSCAEFSVPLVSVLAGIGGGVAGALTFRLLDSRP